MKSKILLRVLSIALVAILLLGTGALSVCAATDDGNQLSLEDAELVPGDTLTQSFKVYTSFFSSVTLRLGLEIDDFDKDLADQLVFRIRQEGSEEVLYEAPASKLAKRKASVRVANIFGPTEERTYCVEIYVPADLDNQYQGTSFSAGFTWQISESVDMVVLIVALVLTALAAVAIVLGWKSPKLVKKQKIMLTGAAVIVVLLITLIVRLCLTVNVTEEKNMRLSHGSFDIVLNDGKPVLGSDIIFEPGMTICKEFTLENKGSTNSFYKIYFSELPQEIAELIGVSILDGNQTLVSSTLYEMTEEKAIVMNDNLLAGEREEFVLCLELTEEIENLEQGKEYELNMFVKAAQRENNPEADFGE